MKARFTRAARMDLRNIWLHGVKNWDEDQAEAYSRKIGTVIELLVVRPEIGKSLNAIKPGYFKFPAGSHLIIYRKSEDTIEVIRILHKSMDVERRL